MSNRQVIIAFQHQMIGTAHVMCRSLGDRAHVGGHDKALSLIFDAESHTLDIVAGLKGGDFHVQDTERNLLEDGHMMVGDAA